MAKVGVLLAAIGLLGVWAAVASLGDLRQGGYRTFLLLYLAATVLTVGALVAAARWQGSAEPRWVRVTLGPVALRLGRRSTWLVLGSAVAFRLVLLGAEPTLSTDCYRYLWEGQVQVAGHNPYVTAPADPALEAQRDEVWERVNHKEVPGVYGPLLQVWFAALGLLGGGLVLLKLSFLLADLLLAWLVWRSLLARGAPAGLVLVFLWHPLLLLEVAGQAHLEVVPVALFFLALHWEREDRPRAAALALGAAIAAKYLPVLLVPAFLLNVRGLRARAGRLALIALPPALLVAPYLLAGGGPVGAEGGDPGGLTAYGLKWRFNDSVFLLLDEALAGLGLSQAFCRHVLPAVVEVPAGFDPADHTTWMRIPPKLLVGLGVVGVLAWLSWPRRDRVDLPAVAFAAGALFLLLSPTVHPWYGLWILPFLPARLARGRSLGWLALTLTLPASYLLYAGADPLAVRLLEYGPLVVLSLVSPIAVGWVMTEARESPPREPCVHPAAAEPPSGSSSSSPSP